MTQQPHRFLITWRDPMSKSEQNIINHVVLAVDASSSMHRHRENLIKVVDNQVAYLARRSQEMKQETRVTVYFFGRETTCAIYDMDVLRLPSIKDLYRPTGMTPLIDASALAIDDLAMTPEKYGDHAFLVYVLTDGEENASRRNRPDDLIRRINGLPENWTMAVLVPDQDGVFYVKRLGFPASNVAVWDATSSRGVAEVGEVVREATDRFMQGRQEGIRGSRSIFSTGVEAVNPQTVQAANLTPLAQGAYILVPVDADSPIREFIERNGRAYVTGTVYYQLSKSEEIQGQKALAVVEKATGRVFTGPQVRKLVGLPDTKARVRPTINPLYEIFVQSTSVNRKLKAGTRVLVLL